MSRKIKRELNKNKTKPPIVNQQCVVYGFQCGLCDVGYVDYTRLNLHNRVKGHKLNNNPPAVLGKMPPDLLKRFEVLKKCKKKLTV